MPTYEYACSSCGHSLEIVHKISDPAPTLCPKCNKPSLERLVSNAAFVLKGAGWYADGYGAKKGQDAKPETATSSEATPSPATPAKESTPKPEPKPSKTPGPESGS